MMAGGVRIRPRPDTQEVISAESVENIVNGVIHMVRFAPLQTGYDVWMLQIDEIEAYVVRSKGKATPDFDETIMAPNRGDICRVV